MNDVNNEETPRNDLYGRCPVFESRNPINVNKS